MAPRRHLPTVILSCLMLSPFLATGCSNSPGSELQGTVRFNGKPLNGGKVTFYHPSRPGRNVTAYIQPDGTYKIMAVPKGNVKVTVVALPPQKKYRDQKTTTAFKVPPVPTKYTDPETTDIVCTVTDTAQRFDIDLQS